MNGIDVMKIREELGLTQQKFADLIGIDRRTVVNWEQGRVIPDSKIKLLNMIIEGKRKDGFKNNINEEIVSVDLHREIMDLKDYIKTLKEFLEEKTTVAELYKSENARLKYELERLKKD